MSGAECPLSGSGYGRFIPANCDIALKVLKRYDARREFAASNAKLRPAV
jgi:hypothetical protein